MNIRVVILTAVTLLAACGRPERSATSADDTRRQAAEEWFTDVAHPSGLDFVHFNGMSGEFYYPEIMAPGVALIDYDNDGDLDVYVVQGQMLGNKPPEQATYPPSVPLRDRLYRNDLQPGGAGAGLHFTDVTDAVGIDVHSYGMGVTVGDIDNDGWVDIYRTGLSGSVMLHNDHGHFTDVTARSRTGNDGAWGVSAAFVDYDRDGWLDLFVGNYLIYSLASDVHCLSVSGQRDYCPPNSYRARPSRLFHNRGNGTFEDVTPRALIGGAYGPALGVIADDLNGDGWLDIYVGNDGQPNQLWINRHDGTFRDDGFVSGAAVSGGGNAEASMGIDAGDFDNDGDDDVIVTNWLDQMNALYVNDGAGGFDDRRGPSGLGTPSLAKTGFGVGWLDADNDGWLDLFVTNGGVARIEAQARTGDPFPLRMTDQLYRNRGDGRFDDVSAMAGKVFSLPGVGRGAAFGDLDNDGDTDIVVAQAAGPVRVLVNQIGNRQHWLGVRLVGRVAAGRQASPALRDMLGTRVDVIRPGQPMLRRRAHTDGSYASASDPRVLVGLGAGAVLPRVRVTWPDGKSDDWADVAIDRYVTLEQGQGR